MVMIGDAGEFTGKERDQETGLDYFGARYYGSALGRFTSPDPIVIMKQKLLDPSSGTCTSTFETIRYRWLTQLECT